jgi:hypothetical protein
MRSSSRRSSYRPTEVGSHDVSFIEYARSDPNWVSFLHNIFNTAKTNVIELMVTPHGELYVGEGNTAPQEYDYGVKMSTINFARPGVVNWSDDAINQIALKTIERFATNELINQRLIHILTTGTDTDPDNPLFGLSVDELIFACTVRIMYLLEMTDPIHRGPTEFYQRQQEDVLPVPESLAATSHSFALNFFTNRPITVQRNPPPSGSPVQTSSMPEDFWMLCVNIFKHKTKRVGPEMFSKLQLFSNLLHANNVRIVLPTTVQLPKLYSLSTEEHNSRSRTTTRVLGIPSKKIKEKGHEHKIVAFCKLPQNISSNHDFISFVKDVLHIQIHIKRSKIECYNWMAKDARGYKNLKTDGYVQGQRLVEFGVFDDQVKADINDPSEFWNKLCIIFSIKGTGTGTRKGTLVQWRLQLHLGVPHLVFNIWNLISSKRKIQQSVAGYSTATTYDIMTFARDIFKDSSIHVPLTARIEDLTCQVAGGLPNTAWIVPSNPLLLEHVYKDRILSLHPPSNRPMTPRINTSVTRFNFVSGLSNISTIFDSCRLDANAVNFNSVISAPQGSRHPETSEYSSFLSVCPVLSMLLGDDNFNTTGISSFGVSLEVKLLKENPDIAERFGIKTLRHFGICVCRYIYDKAFEIYSFISRGLSADQAEAFKQFHDVIYYLNIKQSTFVIHGPGSIQSDLRLQHASRDIKRLRDAYDRLSKTNDGRLEGQSNRKQESIKRTPEFLVTEKKLKGVGDKITKILGEADNFDTGASEYNQLSKQLHEVADFTHDTSSPKVSYLKQKMNGILATIEAILTHCRLNPAPAAGPAPAQGGGSRHYKHHKRYTLRQTKRKQIRNKSLRRRRRFANTNRTKRKY